LERFPDQTRLHYYAGFLQDNLGRYKCAIPHYQELVKADSIGYEELTAAGGPADKLEATRTSYISNLRKLAFFYYKENSEKAITMQQRVVDLDPTNAEEANTLALYSEAIYGAGAGLSAFEQAYQNSPDDLSIALRFGRAAVRNGQYAKAIEPLTKCINAKKEVQTLLFRAEAYENLNQMTNAINDYKSVLELDPDNADVMLNISLAYSSLNNFENASYWINRSLQVKPGYGQAYIVRGELFEIAVSYCQKQRGKDAYEDKLVYERAYAEYEKAKRDPAFISKAKTKQNNLRPFLPTTEDKFMHKNDKIESDCYNFLK
jgi:tetratricopeptide (TPR) repeat protein